MDTLHEEQYIVMIICRSAILGMSNVSYKLCSEIKNIYFLFNNFFVENHAVYEIMCEKYSWTGHRWEYGACALHPGFLRLQTHPQNMKHLVLFHFSNGGTNAPQCNVLRTMPALLRSNYLENDLDGMFRMSFVVLLSWQIYRNEGLYSSEDFLKGFGALRLVKKDTFLHTWDTWN